MKQLKTALLLLLLLASLLSLSACSGGAAWRDDVSAQELAAKVSATMSDLRFAEMNESYLQGAMKLDPADFADYSVNLNAMGTTADEFGVFKAKDAASAPQVKAAVEDYLSFRLETWMSEYMPEEKPKLENARVKVCGLYVMYAILDDAARETAFGTFESALKK